MSQLGISKKWGIWPGELGEKATGEIRERSKNTSTISSSLRYARKCRNKNVFNSMNLGKCEKLGNEQRKLKNRNTHAENKSHTHTHKTIRNS